MQVVSHGNVYDIYDDTLQTYDQLPPQTYVVRFSKTRGFFLEKYVEMEITEPKVYGVHLDKVQKVLNSFERANRSLGVILSGDKGIGKSLFAKILAVEAINKNIPLIVVDTYMPGIASYLESIEQDVMVLFDEFDKTFGEVKSKDGEASPQANLLTLFDGISGGKKLFVITCNELHKLNSYLINRPGRFHYHFRFEYPSVDEIRQYLQDKIPEEQYGEIDSVVSFANKVNLNYDCLRAIAFELGGGLSFKEAIRDLNIINMNKEQYNLTLVYKNGLTATAKGIYIDMFDRDGEMLDPIYLYDKHGENFVDVEFAPSSAVFDTTTGRHVVMPKDFKLTYYGEDDDDKKDVLASAKSSEPEYLIISRKGAKVIHYAV